MISTHGLGLVGLSFVDGVYLVIFLPAVVGCSSPSATHLFSKTAAAFRRVRHRASSVHVGEGREGLGGGVCDSNCRPFFHVLLFLCCVSAGVCEL